MIDILTPQINALENRTKELPPHEGAKLNEIVQQCRILLSEGQFMIADDLLSRVQQHIDTLARLNTNLY